MEKRNLVSKICILASIPGALVLNCSTLLADSFFNKSEFGIWLTIVLYSITIASVIASTVTCGTLGIVFKISAKAFRAIIGTTPSVTLVIFYLIRIGIAVAVALIIIASLPFFPTLWILGSYIHKKHQIEDECYEAAENSFMQDECL